MKIGVMVESFRAGLEGGLKGAAGVCADGVQIYATKGEMHPDALDAAKRKVLRKKIADMGLEIAAICGDFGGHGFTSESENPKRIEDSKKVMDLALDLGSNVVTTHIGVIPVDTSNPRYAVMMKACEELAKYGEKVGASFAIETGPESADVLRKFLDQIGLPKGLAVNFDPANLVMVMREDIPKAVDTLAKYIVHTHAKDGVNLKPVDPEKLYSAFAEGGIEGFHATDYIREVPLGQGDVNFESYLSALRKNGYDGYLTIEREVGENPALDIAEAVKFLRNLISK
jgi:sugar phosphate isomerase/epimerase